MSRPSVPAITELQIVLARTQGNQTTYPMIDIDHSNIESTWVKPDSNSSNILHLLFAIEERQRHPILASPHEAMLLSHSNKFLQAMSVSPVTPAAQCSKPLERDKNSFHLMDSRNPVFLHPPRGCMVHGAHGPHGLTASPRSPCTRAS